MTQRRCSVDGCEKPVHGKGLCGVHYNQARAATAAPCIIAECAGPQVGRGWCNTHWKRWRIYGDPMAPVKAKAATGEPMAWLVDVVADPHREGCRDWPFGVDHTCDDRAMLGSQKAGHIALELDGRPRPLPPGNNMLHSCDRPICVAPWHLRWGTIADNRADCVGRNRHVVITGEASRHHKLTAAQALHIRDSAERIADLARLYGISYQSAWMIRSRRAWKHLP